METGVTGSFEPSDRTARNQPGPLKEHYTLLTTEPSSLQLLVCILCEYLISFLLVIHLREAAKSCD